MLSRVLSCVVVDQQVATFETLEGRRLFSVPVDLDASFSGDGKIIADFGGGNDVAHAVAVQNDGKIVVAGEAQVTVNGAQKTAFAALRYNRDGSLDDGSAKDTTAGDKFGVAGKFTRVIDQGGFIGAVAMTIQKDGKIILAGNATNSPTTTGWDFVRLNKDGTIDSSYGTNGVHVEPFASSLNPRITSMVLLPTGKLVAGGMSEGDCVVVGLTSAGQLDKSFGSNGHKGLDFGTPQIITAMAVDNLGRIVVSGNIRGNGAIGVARLLSNGSEDSFFGTNGRSVFTDVNALPHTTDAGSLMVQPNGQIVVGYEIRDSTNRPLGGVAIYDDQGKFQLDALNGGRTSVTGVVNTPTDGRYLGGTSIGHGAAETFIVADLGLEEENNVGFGSATDHNVANAMTVGPDGKIVQVGYTTAGGGGRNFGIARYIGTPTSALGVITGNVFFDVDKDGVKESEDPNDFNKRVFIDADNDEGWDAIHERSVLTDLNGNYKFFVAPGAYHIREVGLVLEYNSLPVLGSYLVNVAAKKTVSGINFGNATITVAQPKNQINGSVFFDFDGDGFRDIQNPTEPDLIGRTVFLDSNGNSILDPGEPQTKTDLNGNYQFNNLAPGNYRVGDILPAGWTHTDPASGFFDVALASSQAITRRFATTFADPDDTISEVDHIPSNQISVGGAVNFSIANVTDVDLVRFSVKKGQKVGFDLDRATGSSLNAFLRLFDANGNQLASNDDASAPGESKSSDSYLTFTFNTAGNYYIGVSNNANKAYEPRFGYGDNGVGTTGGYKLSLINIQAPSAAAKIASLFGNKPLTDVSSAADDPLVGG